MTVITKMWQIKSLGAVLLATALAVGLPAQQAGNTPPDELLQYVREAKRSGVKDDKIKQQALLVGWPANVVDDALAYEKNSKGGKAATRTAAASAAATPPATASAGPPAAAPPSESAAVAPVGPVAGVKTPIAPATSDTPQDYQIASGDTLQITVWKEPEVSVPSEIVRPDGKISVPLIKDIEVAGLTPKQVETAVTEQLTKYYTDANVTVVVTAMAPKKIYVTGGVKKEGPVPFTNGMTVMQAISEAGGLTDYAKRTKIYILRTENGREYRLDFNYNEVVKGVRIDQNYVLAPNDTVVVPN